MAFFYFQMSMQIRGSVGMVLHNRKVQMMGTTIQLSVEHETPEAVLDKLIERLKEYVKRFSAHDHESELMQVNENAGVMPVAVNDDLYELIKIGKLHSLAEESSLNIAIGPLVKAWGIGFEDATVPSEVTIQFLLSKTDASNIILDDQSQTVFLKYTGMFIDLGALAKGFMADLLIRDFERMNVSAGLINLGGNVLSYGKSPNHQDGYWRIGIQHPFRSRGNPIATLRILDQSVVTSGVYERTFKDHDQVYHHILDRDTGYPIKTELASLTIVSKKSVDGEIWTGRLFGESPEKIIQILNELDGIEGIVITKDGGVHSTKSLKPHLDEVTS